MPSDYGIEKNLAVRPHLLFVQAVGRGEVREHWQSEPFFSAESGWRSYGQPPLIMRFFSAGLHCDLCDSKAEKVD